MPTHRFARFGLVLVTVAFFGLAGCGEKSGGPSGGPPVGSGNGSAVESSGRSAVESRGQRPTGEEARQFAKIFRRA